MWGATIFCVRRVAAEDLVITIDRCSSHHSSPLRPLRAGLLYGRHVAPPATSGVGRRPMETSGAYCEGASHEPSGPRMAPSWRMT